MNASPSVRHGLAALLVMHGIAHLVGAVDAVGAIDGDPVAYAFDRWEIASTPQLVTVASIWIGVAVSFVAAGVVTFLDTTRWPDLLAAVTQVSIVLCVIALPQTVIGLAVNAAVLVVARLLHPPAAAPAEARS